MSKRHVEVYRCKNRNTVESPPELHLWNVLPSNLHIGILARSIILLVVAVLDDRKRDTALLPF